MAQQRRLVTVLFLNIAGRSEMASRTGRLGLDDELWSRMAAIIDAGRGLANRPVSDNTIAVFGAPVAQEDDPERAVRTALALVEELAAFRSAFPGAESLNLHIGVDTGLVLYDTLGLSDDFMIIGDTVNVASGLARAMPEESVVMAYSTFRQVRGVFDTRELPVVELPGRPEPVPAFRVIREKERPFHIDSWTIKGVETRLIGREAEFNQLQEVFEENLTKRSTTIVTMTGETGAGKSRLLDEFYTWLELRSQRYFYFRGQARVGAKSRPFGLWRDAFAFQFQIQDSDSSEVAIQKLEAGISEFLGVDTPEPAHIVGQMIGFDSSESPTLRDSGLDARQIRERAFNYVKEYLTAAAAEGAGGVLFLEDVHLADDDSLALIEYLTEAVEGATLFILATARPSLYERRPEWSQGQPNHRQLDLSLLSPEASRTLVQEILRKVKVLPPDLLALIAERAEGNPFYIEELVRMLIDDQVIQVGPKSWSVTIDRLAEVKIPATLAAVLQASVDALEPAEKEALQRAAIIGEIFWDEAVVYLAAAEYVGNEALARAETLDALAALRGKGLIARRRGSTFANSEAFTFKHVMLRQVTYEGTLRRAQRDYHARAAEWLIAQSGPRASEFAGVIGDHYARAQRNVPAAVWFERAGRQAADTYAQTAALEAYKQALNLLEPVKEPPSVLLMRLQEGMAAIYLQLANYPEAMSWMRQALALAEAGDDLRAQIRIWELISQTHEYAGDYALAAESAERLEAVARTQLAAGDLAGPTTGETALARALVRKGWVDFRLGDSERALALAEEALTYGDQANNQDALANCLNLLGAIYAANGAYDLAREYRQRTLDIHRALGNRSREAASLSNLGEIARRQGDFVEAVGWLQEAVELSIEIGDLNSRYVYQSNLGGALVGLGDLEAAVDNLQQVIDTVGSNWFTLPETLRFLAEAYLAQDRLTPAIETAQKALASAKAAGSPEDIAGAWFVLGSISAQQERPVQIGGDSEEGPLSAASCFDQALAIFTEINMEPERAATLEAWARHELAQGEAADGESRWEEARQIFTRLGMTSQVERMDSKRRTALEGES